MNNKEIHVRALQLGERIDLKGLEREDAFSSVPLAFRTSGDGIAVLFKSGAAVFIGMNPVEEEALIRGLAERISGRWPSARPRARGSSSSRRRRSWSRLGRAADQGGRHRPSAARRRGDGDERGVRLRRAAHRGGLRPHRRSRQDAAAAASAASPQGALWSRSARRLPSSSGWRAASISTRSPTCCGTIPSWSASGRASSTSTI